MSKNAWRHLVRGIGIGGEFDENNPRVDLNSEVAEGWIENWAERPSLR